MINKIVKKLCIAFCVFCVATDCPPTKGRPGHEILDDRPSYSNRNREGPGPAPTARSRRAPTVQTLLAGPAHQTPRSSTTMTTRQGDASSSSPAEAVGTHHDLTTIEGIRYAWGIFFDNHDPNEWRGHASRLLNACNQFVPDPRNDRDEVQGIAGQLLRMIESYDQEKSHAYHKQSGLPVEYCLRVKWIKEECKRIDKCDQRFEAQNLFATCMALMEGRTNNDGNVIQKTATELASIIQGYQAQTQPARPVLAQPNALADVLENLGRERVEVQSRSALLDANNHPIRGPYGTVPADVRAMHARLRLEFPYYDGSNTADRPTRVPGGVTQEVRLLEVRQNNTSNEIRAIRNNPGVFRDGPNECGGLINSMPPLCPTSRHTQPNLRRPQSAPRITRPGPHLLVPRNPDQQRVYPRGYHAWS